MNESNEPRGIDRRVVLKGAAWSVPVLAAAVAVPAATASVVPDCPTCIKPGVRIAGAWTAGGAVVSNSSTLVFTNAFGLNAIDCGFLENIFQPYFVFVVLSATLTMSRSNGTLETYESSTGLSVGSGVLGLLGAMPGVFTFNDVTVPNGIYAFGSGPTRPTKLSVAVDVTFQWGLGVDLLCPYVLEWDLNGWGAGTVALGVGPVGFAGTAAAA